MQRRGCLPDTSSEVLYCPERAMTLLYQGSLEPKVSYRLPIPLPSDLPYQGKFTIGWTIAVLCPIDSNHPGDYTLSCVEDTFYPHSGKFQLQYDPKNHGKKQTKILYLKTDAEKITQLKRAGWKMPAWPKTESGNLFPLTEEERRKQQKWDTVVRRFAGPLTAESLHEPFIILQAIGRHKTVDAFDYAAVVTISAPDFRGDLYGEITKRFPVLQPVRLRAESEIRVKI